MPKPDSKLRFSLRRPSEVQTSHCFLCNKWLHGKQIMKTHKTSTTQNTWLCTEPCAYAHQTEQSEQLLLSAFMTSTCPPRSTESANLCKPPAIAIGACSLTDRPRHHGAVSVAGRSVLCCSLHCCLLRLFPIEGVHLSQPWAAESDLDISSVSLN